MPLGLPPNTRVQFELTLSDQNLWIENRPNNNVIDTAKYKYKIKELCLFCPVASLSDRVSEDLLKRW